MHIVKGSKNSTHNFRFPLVVAAAAVLMLSLPDSVVAAAVDVRRFFGGVSGVRLRVSISEYL